jgi:microcystin-dependent protein
MQVKVYTIDVQLPRWLKRAIVFGAIPAAVLLGAVHYLRADVTVPNIFSNGDVLSAEKINANFSTLAATVTTLQGTVSSNAVPAGTVVAFAGTTPPTGWLLCDGSLVSRSAYPALFAAIQVTYGVGDSINTFVLPDHRGRFLRGWDSTGANVSGEKDRTLGQYENGSTALPQASWSVAGGDHTHPGTGFLYAAGTANDYTLANGSFFYFSATGIGHSVAHSHSISGGDPETRPLNAAVMYLIKY